MPDTIEIPTITEIYRQIFNELELLSKGVTSPSGCRSRIKYLAEIASALGLNIQVPTIKDLEKDLVAQQKLKIDQVTDKLDGVEEEGEEDWCQPSYEEQGGSSYE